MEERTGFVAQVFDLDGDELIGAEDLHAALLSGMILKRGIEESAVNPEDQANLDFRVADFLKERKTMEFGEFVKILEGEMALRDVLDTFEIIPSPSKEFEIIKELFAQDRKDKTKQSCHIISFKWWNMWHLYVTSCQEPLSRRQNTVVSPPEEGGFFNEELPPTCRSKSTMKLQYVFDPVEATADERGALRQNESERPGEIDNSDLEGPIKGLLRDNLMVCRVTISE